MSKIKSKVRLVLIFLLLGGATVKAQKGDKPRLLPLLDSSIRSNKLENGLTYYIKNLPEADSTLNLRLLVKAGTDHQDQNQLNIAHFLEHMAFKPSKHFPDGISHFLDHSLEMNMSKFAANGTTGSKSTEYKFNAPIHNKKTLETGLLWFKDIAKGLTLTTEDIDNERGVLVQELILKNSYEIGLRKPIINPWPHIPILIHPENLWIPGK